MLFQSLIVFVTLQIISSQEFIQMTNNSTDYKKTMHHYTGFFTDEVLDEITWPIKINGQRYNKTDIHVLEFGFDGVQFHYGYFQGIKITIDNSSCVYNNENKICSILFKRNKHTARYLSKRYRGIVSFAGIRNRVYCTKLVYKKQVAPMIYGEEQFYVKTDLVNFVGNVTDMPCDAPPKCVLWKTLNRHEIRLTVNQCKVEKLISYLPKVL